MLRRKTAALCNLVLLMTTISPAAKADLNGQCDPYSAALPVLVAIAIAAGVRILAKKYAVPMVTAGVTIAGTAIVNLLDDDDDDSPPPPIEVTVVMPQPIDDSDNSQSGGGSDRGETPEEDDAPEAPPESPGGGDTGTYGGGYGSCPTSPYTF